MKSLIPWKRKNQDAVLSTAWGDDWSGPFKNIFAPLSPSLGARIPVVDVSETRNDVTVRAEVPGMSEKDLRLTWQSGVLRIRGEKSDEREEKRKNGSSCSRSYGCFSRDIPLGDRVDWKGARAKYHSGVLTVKLPKREAGKKAMEIKVQ